MDTLLDTPAPPGEPQLLKFRLRQVFVVVTLASVFLALVVTTDGPWPWIIGLSTLMVGGHVLGNLIGTRLRDTSPEIQRWRAASPWLPADIARVTPDHLVAGQLTRHDQTHLAGFSRLVRGMRWFLVAGFFSGLVLGGVALTLTIGNRITWAGWVVGTLSGAVLGTWLAFLAVSFAAIARDAWCQAHEG